MHAVGRVRLTPLDCIGMQGEHCTHVTAPDQVTDNQLKHEEAQHLFVGVVAIQQTALLACMYQTCMAHETWLRTQMYTVYAVVLRQHLQEVSPPDGNKVLASKAPHSSHLHLPVLCPVLGNHSCKHPGAILEGDQEGCIAAGATQHTIQLAVLPLGTGMVT
jgi:hypothetical protein